MKEKFNQIKYQNEYNKEKYVRLEINLYKGEKEIFKEQARKRGYKDKEFSKYIRDLIYDDIKRSGGVLKKLLLSKRSCHTKARILRSCSREGIFSSQQVKIHIAGSRAVAFAPAIQNACQFRRGTADYRCSKAALHLQPSCCSRLTWQL